MEGHRLRVGALAWSSSLLSSGSRDKSILQRDIRAQEDFVSKLSGHKSEVRFLDNSAWLNFYQLKKFWRLEFNCITAFPFHLSLHNVSIANSSCILFFYISNYDVATIQICCKAFVNQIFICISFLLCLIANWLSFRCVDWSGLMITVS